ncbi:DivIVA domain-containing protein, partial [Ilumatobacter nonamiensis]|uniref:DivIVA domain-containing protein n=1 Tax=Ilumatobacter nonamiensis TaxID=467093 RepID=UPI0011D20DF5
MDISPHQVRTAEFKSAKRGLDPDEVRQFLDDVASELERAQNQSTAMEARARAAVAR